MYTIIYQASAEKELGQLSLTEYKKVRKAIDLLAENPFPHGYLKLEGFDSKLYRIRKGDYRIIYSVEHQIVTVTILKIAHRKKVYRR